MTIDQAVQNSYMAPNVFNLINSSDLRELADEIKTKLINIKHNCPQSQKKDLTIYQYRHALNVITQVID